MGLLDEALLGRALGRRPLAARLAELPPDQKPPAGLDDALEQTPLPARPAAAASDGCEFGNDSFSSWIEVAIVGIEQAGADALEITVRVENLPNNGSGFNVPPDTELRIDGAVEASDTFDVLAGESAPKTYTVSGLAAGDHSVAFAMVGASGCWCNADKSTSCGLDCTIDEPTGACLNAALVAAVQPASASAECNDLSPADADPGETITATYTVRNESPFETAATVAITLSGEPVASADLTLAANETRTEQTLTFPAPSEPGAYDNIEIGVETAA